MPEQSKQRLRLISAYRKLNHQIFEIALQVNLLPDNLEEEISFRKASPEWTEHEISSWSEKIAESKEKMKKFLSNSRAELNSLRNELDNLDIT